MPASDAAPIRAGLIGCGNSGRYYHLPFLLDDDRLDLRFVATGSAGSLGTVDLPADVTRITGWEEAIQQDDVELVVIALPHHLHFPVAEAALTRGKHVLLEKPATVRTAEMDALISIAERRGLTLMVHHQRRWEEDFVHLLDVVRSGELGDVWRVVVTRSHQGAYVAPTDTAPHAGTRPLEWARSKQAGGGVGRVIGPHPVDHLLTLVDSPATSVAGRLLGQDGEDVEHWMGIDVTFASGALGHVEIFRRSGIAPPRFTVWGTRGMAVATDGSRIDIQPYDGARRTVSGLRRPGTLGREIYDDLIGAVRHGRRPRVGAQEARDVVQVIELAERSSAQGGAPVAVTPPGA